MREIAVSPIASNGSPTGGATGNVSSSGRAVRAPAIGIVIPVFGHSRLVAEAIYSIQNQSYDGDIHTVVVIDGDRDNETLQTVASFVSTGSRSFSALYRPNGRLPAARNTGINYLSECYRNLFGVLFLDADNRLSHFSVAEYVHALATDPSAGWAYPDVTFFGLTWGSAGYDIRETAPVYSKLRHLIGNICEAGSMVRSEVFERGIRFDETFIHGYEDWEFWLQCLGHGYHGTRVANAGFLYRRRADSMLSDADRRSQALITAIRRKHSHLFDKSSKWASYAAAFRPLLYFRVDSQLFALSTSDHMEKIELDDILKKIQAGVDNFHHTYLPRYGVFPLFEESAELAIDVPMLQRIIRLSVQQEIIYIGDNGDVSETRNDSSCFELVPFTTLMADEGSLPQRLRTPIVDQIRRFARQGAVSRASHMSRRYSGPPSFLIDTFLDASAAEERPPLLEPMVFKAISLVVNAITEDDGDLISKIIENSSNVLMLNILGRGAVRFSETSYLGTRLAYISSSSPHEILSMLSYGFERIYVVNDLAYLFTIGDLKAFGREIIFICSRRLGADEIVSLQGVEHSLSRILCSIEDIARLSAVGIPSRKLQTVDDHFRIIG